MDPEFLRQESQRMYLWNPLHHAKVDVAVALTEQGITNGGRFTADDRQIATAAASMALVLAVYNVPIGVGG